MKKPMKQDTNETFVLKQTQPLALWSESRLSNWLFLFVNPIIAAGKHLKHHPLALRNHESARFNTDRLDHFWQAEVSENKDNPNLLNAYKKAFSREYWSIAYYKLAWTVFTWAGAWYLLKQMLAFLAIRGKDLPDLDGHMYAMALFLAGLFSSIAIHQQYAESNRMGIKIKAATMGLIYRKSLKLSRVKGGAGEVINLLTGDVGRINDAVINFHFLWAAFVEVTLILAISIYEIGVSALPAVAWVFILLPVQMYLGKRTDVLGRGQANETSKRVHMMSELLTAIKLIKFYAWEVPFATKISAIRSEELTFIYDGLINKTINYTVVFAVPVLVALSCLATYVATGNVLTASVSFTVLSVFNTLRYPFFMLPMAVKSTVGALAAIDRMNAFFQLEEVEELKRIEAPAGCDLAFDIEDSDFKWDGTEGDVPTIRNISLKIKKGSKVAIVGETGSGKSSILASLLGQIRQTRGPTAKIYGSTAYMSQEAWLLNLTLRENILFGKKMDATEYNETVRVAGLQRDLTLLIAGDQTEIAERGANLSGGQRQRVSLARAVYYDADIVLMDDPLSAVDNHVGRHIFEECFMKYLKNKTLVCAINQLQYLCEMDHVVFVRDGAIYAQGSYDELMATNDVFRTLVSAHVAESDEIEEVEEEIMNIPKFDPTVAKAPAEEPPTPQEIMELNAMSVTARNQMSIKPLRLNNKTIRSMMEISSSTSISGVKNGPNLEELMAQNEISVISTREGIVLPVDDDAAKKELGKLVGEDMSTATAGSGDFLAYAQTGSGTLVSVLVVLSFVLVHGIRIGGDYWLRLWVPRVGNFSDAVYIGVYGAFALLFSLGAFGRGYFLTVVTTNKAKVLHDNVFDASIHAPMAFFDTTPVARILACFSKHQLHVDDTMLDAAMQALQYFPLGLGAFVLCAVLVKWNWAPCIGILVCGWLLLRKTSAADQSTKNLEAITKPPIFSHLTATLEGLLSVRSYHAETRFDSMNLEKIDTNHEALFAMQSVKSYQALYLDILSSLVIYFSAMLLVFERRTPGIDSVAGLALSNALQMLVFVQWTVRQWGEVENQMSSVGQLVYYGKTKPEAPFEVPDKKPDASWPQQGMIRFNDVELKYQKFGVSVLKNVTLSIYPGEKIGIVGRTGSGKSTLLISLLRIVEPCNGLITIDDLDVSGIGLHDLRNKIAIIPQEPVMFVGTIRSNLDPFNKSTDEEIWHCLDAVFLGEKFRAAPSKLETLVTENGKSVSQGQRQLLCIARAILSKAKILVLDEATASLDAQTDLMIQEAIKTNFGNLTMLTIAHRLNTIIESDRVLVMDAGRVTEFDEPIDLLKNKDGIFYSLVAQSGPASHQKLQEVAQRAHDERVKNGYGFPALKEVPVGPMKIKDIARM